MVNDKNYTEMHGQRNIKYPDSVTGFFSDIFPSDRSMALGSTQPLVKMSTRNVSWG